MSKQDLALNNPQGLICHKEQPNQSKPNQTKSSFVRYKKNPTKNKVKKTNTSKITKKKQTQNKTKQKNIYALNHQIGIYEERNISRLYKNN